MIYLVATPNFPKIAAAAVNLNGVLPKLYFITKGTINVGGFGNSMSSCAPNDRFYKDSVKDMSVNATEWRIIVNQ